MFAENYNYFAYLGEQNPGISFELYDARSVARLIRDHPKILPEWKIDEEKDYTWNAKKVNNIVTQGIIQGEGVEDITKRLSRDLSSHNENKMRMFARTAMTGAQNAGRQQCMEDTANMGVETRKEWIATHDKRTRDSHRHLDGQEVAYDEVFMSDHGAIRYPGDPEADPAEVFNCRCTMITIYPKYEDRTKRNWREDEIIDGQTYAEWKRGKKAQQNSGTEGRTIVQGKDITGTWERRPDKFDFEIEDVINAQGFDGLPKVVSREEFDKAVNESGFIAQRTYSAPDKETLNAYRDQLYNGKWYVDCSTGGSQYGQGMYCAADYNGQITDGMKAEMAHYKELGTDRFAEKIRPKTADEAFSMLKEKYGMNDVAIQMARKTTYDEEFLQFIKGLSRDQQRAFGPFKAGIEMVDAGNLEYIKVNAPSYTETFTLAKDAKIVVFDDISKMYQTEYLPRHTYESAKSQARNDILDGMGLSGREKIEHVTMLNLYNTGTTEKQYEKLKSLEQKYGISATELQKKVDNRVDELQKGKIRDIGSFAASLGYDAINAEGHGQSGSYTVILNRTKCIFLEDSND